MKLFESTLTRFDGEVCLLRTLLCSTDPVFRLSTPHRRSCSGDTHRDPVETVHHMQLEANRRPECGERVAPATTKQLQGLTLTELSAKWSEVVQALKEDGVTVINPGHALEGALLIRCAESFGMRTYRCLVPARIVVCMFPSA